jgi:hypothetical protein
VNPSPLAVTFSAPQLAVIVLVLAAILWWGFQRLVGGIDKQFDKLNGRLDDIPKVHPTRPEMNAAVDGVHRRLDDLHTVVHGSRPARGDA